ncbi:D-alanine--D-alanine ligase [Hazenella coriacea]|uniref:D-alanine--D-alanine ligase n=1 Tax=Hazenella coriacea TaxID=1179467 RepID=A0A4R3LBF1_9BACL|nr:D-alanine--D-alanine ligase [Hazenella coriacea]TCS96540.1 D-alanine-D-alanine ligase [Hazenella coriacea]
MSKRLRVAVLFGGKSGEHDVSLSSAASVIKSMDLDRYEVIPIGITRDGLWKIGQESLPMIAANLDQSKREQLQSQLPVLSDSHDLGHPSIMKPSEIDVVFPVLHGTFGEDGTIQGFLEIANLPYVGAGVLASAVGMDKVMTKKIFEQAGLPQGRYVYFLKSEWNKDASQILQQIEGSFGYPCFVKPANLGSSVGISKASTQEELVEAIDFAAQYDRKILVEEFIPAHEIEVAVLGNDEPQASQPGEIVSSNDFYDYKAKYIDGKSEMRIPAELPEETKEKVRQMAVQAYKAIDGSGLSRVDFFIRKDNGEILINEINTMPGFTPFSMYAKLWEHSGISYPELVSKLIQLALDRFKEKNELITTHEIK